MDTERVTFEDPDVQETADRIAAWVAGGGDEREAQALSMWHAQLADARASLAKLLVVLESHEGNRQPLLTAALTWAVLDAKLPVATQLRTGWIMAEGSSVPNASAPAVPHLWAITPQPQEVLAASRAIWGEHSPRAAPRLVTTLGGFPVSYLTDAVILGRRLRTGKAKGEGSTEGSGPTACASVPLPDPSRWRMAGPGSDVSPFVTTREARIQFENARYVAENPEEYLRWAVPTETRHALYPLITLGVFKEDPTRHEYIRINENEVQRLIRVQEEAKAAKA